MNKIFLSTNKSLYVGVRNNFKFYKFPVKNFALPLSFKNRINSLFKLVHPDVLGSECPDDFRKTNEKSVQDLNAYIETLDKDGNKFENKIITFYVAISQKQKDDSMKVNFPKFEVKLEEIKPNTSKSNKVSLQLNLNSYIEEIMRKIQKLKNEGLRGKSISSGGDNPSHNLNDAKNEETLDRIKILKSEDILNELGKTVEELQMNLRSKKIQKKNREQ